MHVRRRLLAFLAALVFIFSITPCHALATSAFSDIKDHWAKAAVLRWSEFGILSGYPDGSFRPDALVTRGELAKIINELMGFPEAPEEMKLFSDLEQQWYATHINALAQQRAYLVAHGAAKGDAALTREEAVAMVYNAFPIGDSYAPKRFTDASEADPEYAEKIKRMHNAGFLSGFPDGTFRPKQLISRAEIVTILNNMIDEYISQPGVYHGLEGKRVLVAVPGVEIQGTGDLAYLVVSPRAGAGKTTVTHTSKYATIWVTAAGSVTRGQKNTVLVEKLLHTYDSRFAGGIGAAEHPYIISTQAQLSLLGEYLGEGYKGMCFELANNITLVGQWTPIGSYDSGAFSANLDGKGYAIKGLEIISNGPNDNSVGLFSYIRNGTIRNLGVSGRISVESSAILPRVGGICGNLRNATLENCSAQIDISVSSTSSPMVGGLVGYSELGTTSGCNSGGSITVDATNSSRACYAYVGGILGGSGTISKTKGCASSTNISVNADKYAVVGGVVGLMNSSSLSECTASGTIKAASLATDKSFAYAGGVIGHAPWLHQFQGCKSDATVSAHAADNAYAGGIAGRAESPSADAVIEACSAQGTVTASSVGTTGIAVAGGIAGYAFQIKIASGYSAAAVTASGGYYSFAGGIAGLLTKNVDGEIPSTAQSCFSIGSVLAEKSLMQNNAGGIAGQIHSSVAIGCGTSARVSTSGNPGYFNAAGGFAGSIVEGSSALDCYSTGSVTSSGGYASIGGFVGRAEGLLANCYTASAISADQSLNDYSYQGLVGTVRSEIITTSCGIFTGSQLHFYDNATEAGGKITKVSNAEAQSETTYVAFGWDFTDTWLMPNASDRYKLPILRDVFEDVQRALSMPQHMK